MIHDLRISSEAHVIEQFVGRVNKRDVGIMIWPFLNCKLKFPFSCLKTTQYCLALYDF